MARPHKAPRIVWRADRGIWAMHHGRVRISLQTRDREKAEDLLELYLRAPGRFWNSLSRVENILQDEQLVKAVKRALSGAQWRSRTRGETCELSVEDVVRLIHQQGGCCAISGMPFSDTPSTDGRRRPFSPSIDRIDNSAGYTIENIQVVTSIVNNAKADYGDEEFVSMCRAVALRDHSVSTGQKVMAVPTGFEPVASTFGG